MALLGGTRRLWGPLVGVVPFIVLTDFINAQFPDYTNIVIGVAFIAIVFLVPDGVLGRIEQAIGAMRARAGPSADAREEPAE
jgi:branched-chain amino acid transport system permease protein